MDFDESNCITEIILSLRCYLQLVYGHCGTLARSYLTSNPQPFPLSLWFAPGKFQRFHQPDAQEQSHYSEEPRLASNYLVCLQEDPEPSVNLCEKFILLFRPNDITKDQVGIFMGTENRKDQVAFKHLVWVGIRATAIKAALEK